MRRSLVRLALAVAFWLAASLPALACPSCFGQAEGPLIDAARLGIWLMLGVTLCLQAGFVAFFLYLRRRARQAESEALDEEWTRLQREHGPGWRSA
jgi:predicted MFS family arabinose efflux permease